MLSSVFGKLRGENNKQGGALMPSDEDSSMSMRRSRVNDLKKG